MARVAFKASFTGDKEMKAKLMAVAGDKGMRKYARVAALEVGGVILERMKAETPVKSGKLVDSEVMKVMVSSKKEDIRITLTAGGPDVPYARVVHETHKTKSKFMERPLLAAAPTAGRDIAEKIDLGVYSSTHKRSPRA